MKNKRDLKIQSSEIWYCKDFRYPQKPRVATIYSLKEKEAYLNYIKGNENYIKFKGNFLENGTKVNVFDYTDDSLFVNIFIQNQNPTMSQRHYEELWIWHEFLVKTPSVHKSY